MNSNRKDRTRSLLRKKYRQYGDSENNNDYFTKAIRFIQIISIISLIWGGIMTGLYVNLYYSQKNTSWYFVNNMPLAEKMAFYYHCCRMNEFNSGTRKGRVDFAVKLILHSTNQYSWFIKTDNMFDKYNCWKFGNSMMENWQAIVNIFCVPQDVESNSSLPYLTCWTGGSSAESIFSWIQDNINYTSDDLTNFGNNVPFDLYLSPIETLMMRKGDCEDIAILGASMFENNGYETMYAIIHDDNYPLDGGLHHALFYIKVKNPSAYLEEFLWYTAEEGTQEWLPVDILWSNSPFIGDRGIQYLNYYLSGENPIKTCRCFKVWEDILTVKVVD